MQYAITFDNTLYSEMYSFLNLASYLLLVDFLDVLYTHLIYLFHFPKQVDNNALFKIHVLKFEDL
jgi:hypothetical protein